MTTTTWTISSRPSGNLPARVDARKCAGRRRHQEAIAFVHDPLRILRVDVRMPARHAMFAADAANSRHRVDDSRMIVFARVAEVLREVALADQDHADAGYLFQHAREVVDRLRLFAHDDDEYLAVRRQRPHVSLLVVLLLRHAPIANRLDRRIAALTFGLVPRGGSG